MVGKNGCLVFIIFISLCLLAGLFAVFKTEKMVNFTAKYFKWILKFYGFEGDIKPTSKAISICRNWNIFMLTIFIILMIFIIFFAPK